MHCKRQGLAKSSLGGSFLKVSSLCWLKIFSFIVWISLLSLSIGISFFDACFTPLAQKLWGFVKNGQSTVGGPKWTKMDLFRPKRTKEDHFGPFWSRECLKSARNNVILTRMVVLTILVQHAFRQCRHRVNEVSRGGGPTVFNQTLTGLHGIWLKSG